MNRLVFLLPLFTLVFASCDQPTTEVDQQNTTQQSIDKVERFKHLVDHRPELVANEDSMRYTFMRPAESGLYLVNRMSQSPVNILPIEVYEKLFSAFLTCTEKDSKYMVVDRRKPALISDFSIVEVGDEVHLQLPEQSASSSAFLERFREDTIAFVANEKILFLGIPEQVNGKNKLVLDCDKSTLAVIQAYLAKELVDPMKEKEVE